MNRILVIDIGGNYGASVTDKLQECLDGSSIALIDRANAISSQAFRINVELLNPASLFDCISSYNTVVLIYLPSDQKFTKKNLEKDTGIIRDIVNFCLEANTKKLIFLGSVLSLGLRKDFEVLDENCIYSHNKYQNNNSLSAFYCEQEVWRAGAEGLSVTILNVPIIWNDLHSDLFKTRFVMPFLKYFHNARGAFGFVALSDILEWMVQVVKEDFANERFILCAENLKFSGIIQLLKQQYSELSIQDSLFHRFSASLSNYLPWLSSKLLFDVDVAKNYKHFSISFDNRKSLKISGNGYKTLRDYIFSNQPENT